MRQNQMLAGAALLTALAFAQPASALTMKECSVKYKAEQEAGTLVAKSWNDFRKAECGPGATLEVKTPGKTAKETAKDTAKEAKDAKAAGLKAVKSSEFKPTAAKDTEPEAAKPETHALTQKECSEKYQAAKAKGALGGATWNEFRKAECGAEAAALSTTKSGMVFPKTISKKYAGESAGKARRLTCLDQYRANKATGKNGDLRWIEKGGGYYSECNRILSQKVGNAQ